MKLNEKIFLEWYNRSCENKRGYIAKRLFSQNDFDDLNSMVKLAMWNRRNDFEGETYEDFFKWHWGFVHKKLWLINRQRMIFFEKNILLNEDNDGCAGIEDIKDETITEFGESYSDDLVTAIKKIKVILTESEFEALVLWLGGPSYKEIALRLNKTEKQIDNNVTRAIRKIKPELTNEIMKGELFPDWNWENYLPREKNIEKIEEYFNNNEIEGLLPCEKKTLISYFKYRNIERVAEDRGICFSTAQRQYYIGLRKVTWQMEKPFVVPQVKKESIRSKVKKEWDSLINWWMENRDSVKLTKNQVKLLELFSKTRSYAEVSSLTGKNRALVRVNLRFIKGKLKEIAQVN